MDSAGAQLGRPSTFARALGTHRFQREVVGGRPIGVSQRLYGLIRAIAMNNYSTQAKRLRWRLITINTPFPATARWKRCVPRGGSTAPQKLDVNLNRNSLSIVITSLFFLEGFSINLGHFCGHEYRNR